MLERIPFNDSMSQSNTRSKWPWRRYSKTGYSLMPGFVELDDDPVQKAGQSRGRA